MRDVSAELAAAIEAPERVILHRVTVDWDLDGVQTPIDRLDDLSSKIGSISVDQSLNSSLPEQVRVVPGSAVAQCDINLDRGSVVFREIPATYESVSSNSSGAGTSTTATVTKPTGAQPGEMIALAIFYGTFLFDYSIPRSSNVEWTSLAFTRTLDTGGGNRVEGHLLIRRVTVDEPSSYTFEFFDSAQAWVAAAVRIGQPGFGGIHAYSTTGQRPLDDVPVSIFDAAEIEVTLDDCVVVSFFGGAIDSSTTWSAQGGDTERVDIQTTAGVSDVTMSVMTATGVGPGSYIKQAGVSTPIVSALGYVIAFSPLTPGDESTHAAWTFSELNTASPYAGKQRTGRPTQWDVGFATSNGFEYVPVFTGYTTKSSASSRAKRANLTALDNREKMRAPITLPNVIAESPINTDSSGLPLFPGLNVTWIVSYLFAFAFYKSDSLFTGISLPNDEGPFNNVGYFAAPQMIDSTFLWAPMHGSLAPFQGTTQYAYTLSPLTGQIRPRFTIGPFVAATQPAPIDGFTIARYSGTSQGQIWDLDAQQRGRVEFWAKLNDDNSTVSVWLEEDQGPLNTYARVDILATRVFQLQTQTPVSALRTITGPTLADDGEWHFCGVFWDTIAGSATFRVDETETVVAFSTFADFTLTSVTQSVKVTITNQAQISDLTCSGGMQPFGSGPVVELTDPWRNEDFVPSAFIDFSNNNIDTIPVINSGMDKWDIVVEIAEAEFAAAYFDVDGYPHYRTSYSDVTDAGQTVVRELTTRNALKDLDYESGIGQVANVVTVGYVRYEPVINQSAYRPTGVIKLRPFEEVVIFIEYPGVIIDLGSFNIFEANTQPDGTGDEYTASITWSVTLTGLNTAEIRFINESGTILYLVDSNGSPSPELTGSWMGQASESPPAEISDTYSISRYDVQQLPISSSPWRQSYDMALMIATTLVSDLAKPHPVLRNVPIVADPRLELGDLTTIRDINGLGVNDIYRLTARAPRMTAGDGFGMEVTLRHGAVVAVWDEDNWDGDEVWGP